jgi:hypothetical protein
MKKVLLGLLIGLSVGLPFGFLVGNKWESLKPSNWCTHGASAPDIESYGLSGFCMSAPPEFSSRHFFFRTGFGDVDEYWSFELPPDRAREFLDDYVKRSQLPSIPATSEFPDWIRDPGCDHEDWNPQLWFERFEDLSEIYHVKYHFVGYSQEKNRIYLMNWND